MEHSNQSIVNSIPSETRPNVFGVLIPFLRVCGPGAFRQDGALRGLSDGYICLYCSCLGLGPGCIGELVFGFLVVARCMGKWDLLQVPSRLGSLVALLFILH